MEFAHRSVLLHECIDALAIKPDGIYLDGTLGGAGHSLEICRSLTTGRLIGVDRDLVALEAAKKRLYSHAKKVTLVHDNFENVGAILTALGLDRIDGMLFDLGVSSPQLDDAERGFSYMADAPLDMRMDRDQSLTAYEIVNNWPREELKSILYEYGEERCAPQIAAAIERVRTDHPIETTLELVDIIRSAMPPSALREKQHPAKRSFQAIRIAVNDELGAVRQGMEAAIDHLNPGGRLVVITFHSLEDRIVKNVFQDAAKGCTCPPSFPVCVCGHKPKIKILTKKPIIATREDRLLEVADLCRRCGLRKPVRVVQGGENRTQSVLAAACEADAKAQFIAVHDGARPLVLPEDVDAVIRFACQTHAAAPALPVTDTVKTADETGRVTGTPDRSTLFAVQTPQVFQADVLKAALQSAAEAKLPLTDDCAAVERLGKQVYLLPGNPENIKITRPLDLAVAAAILRQREERNA